ncbi:sugar ABC transporter substrate-binding protein [Luteimonas sp. SJ-92]|uniref:Sugar ABC transporter substrate-binding protein n=1 Tax=Luteimonas salinisoli TaxID=2752307 RepID=A0A853JI81_9GAMM|nr:sugar ABC transporter substrate-binding protein [Luteimonas salinisoli]NZA28444.1 sugar ABC transporter substrate-binding protein [Luteimonas salinisoli]
MQEIGCHLHRVPREPWFPRAERPLRALVLGCLALLLAACGGDDARTEIRFWAMGREAEVVSELIAEFEREHPDIRVRIQQIPWTSAHEKLLTAFAADALPDICQLGNTWVPEFAVLGALEPLQPYVDASAVVEQGDYFEGIWDTNVIDGKLLGVPWYVDTRLLFYRKDILAAAGFDAPPRSWADWEAAMAAIGREVGPDRYAAMLPLNEFEQLLSLGLQQEDPLLREDGTRGNFRSPGFRRALAFYANTFEQGWAPPMSETQISNVWDEFGRGFFAFYVSGPWNIREFRNRLPADVQDDWATAPLPGPDGPGAGIAGGTSLVLFRQSRSKQASWQLVEFLSRPDIQQRFHALIGNLPPRRSTWEHPALQQDEYAHAFRDQLERVKPTPKVLEWERIMQEMRLASERVVRGGVPQDAALAALDARVDALLEKRRWVREQAAAP